MSKSFKAMWLGDEDPTAQIIRMGDLRFIKGETTDVPADHAFAEMIRNNPTFAIDDSKAEPVDAIEPVNDPDEGTEKGAIRDTLRGMGINVVGNPSLTTLRGKLAEATK